MVESQGIIPLLDGISFAGAVGDRNSKSPIIINSKKVAAEIPSTAKKFYYAWTLYINPEIIQSDWPKVTLGKQIWFLGSGGNPP